MSNNETSTSKKQECPYLPDLMKNQTLRHKLERERKRREAAELSVKMLTFIILALIAFIVGAVPFLVLYVGISAEIVEAYARLFFSCAALMIAFAFTLLTVEVILHSIIRRRKERKEEKS